MQQPVAPRKPNQYRLTFDEKGNAQIADQPKAQPKPAANPQSVTGLEEGFSGMARGLIEGPRQQLFDAFKEGKTRMSGVDDPILSAAKKKLDPAKTDKAAFDKFIDAYQQARAKAEAAAAKRELKNQAKSQTTALDKQEAAIRKRLDELTRQSKGASC